MPPTSPAPAPAGGGIGANGVLLVRGEDGEIRAFANTCRHRGHELLACGANAKRRSIVCPYHAWSYRLDGALRNAPGFSDVDGFDPEDFGLAELRLVELARLAVRRPQRTGRRLRRARRRHGGRHRALPPRGPDHRRPALLRAGHQLEGDRRELPGVLPLLDHPSRAVPDQPADQRREPRRSTGSWMGGWMSIIEGAETMSLTASSGGVAIKGLSEHELRTVMYLVGYPNLLVSLHPDYVMTHLMTPLAADRTHVECAWAFPSDVAAQPDFDPSYAVDFWDLTNRQDWAACESVQRGLSSPHARPGPLAPDEDGVYQFVTRVARAYAGTPAS